MERVRLGECQTGSYSGGMQGQECNTLLVQDEGGIHEVAVTQVPFHLHGMPEALATEEIQVIQV